LANDRFYRRNISKAYKIKPRQFQVDASWIGIQGRMATRLEEVFAHHSYKTSALMPPPTPQALKFTIQTPPVGDLNHFAVTAVAQRPVSPLSRASNVMTDIVRPAGALALGDSGRTLDVAGVIAKYQSLSGNQPHSYGNSVALWNSLLPNLATTPLKVGNVPTNDQAGEVFLDYGLGQTNYCVTYQLGDPTTMCALAQIRMATRLLAMPMFVSIEIKSVTTDSIRVFYNTLPGYKPATYRNWIGIWPGFALPYDAPAALNSAPVTLDYTQGYLNLPFTQIAEDYTMVYFTGKDVTNAAAVLYFTVDGSQ
jgi:hypothetical protein